jgi:predicted signal transduction protein with EAL and GGDEF domain
LYGFDGDVYLSDSQGGIDDLLRKVNLAMRDAKLTGKNRFVLFNASLRKYEEDTGALERALKIAVDEGCGEFQVFYQPIVSAKNRKNHRSGGTDSVVLSELGLVSPVKFIPVAETTGFDRPYRQIHLEHRLQRSQKMAGLRI